MMRFRTVLICHHDAPLHIEGVARWMASWSDLCGIVVIEEPAGLFWKRVRRERSRVGVFRLFDVLAFRLWYRLRWAARDAAWRETRLHDLQTRYPQLTAEVPILRVPSPNVAEAQRFIEVARPTLVLALCKNILAERVFSVPTHGTFVLHPGICPEYRNAHGCFWALAQGDLEHVGMTMLRIDRGIDTGPVFGYFRAAYDEQSESHIVIQHRMTLDNLDAIAATFQAIVAGHASTVPTAGRTSHVWGQPWLTAYLRWRRAARRRGATGADRRT
ncbi:MAG: formyltransferase family protein [Gemmatimonadaceae bacterium]